MPVLPATFHATLHACNNCVSMFHYDLITFVLNAAPLRLAQGHVRDALHSLGTLVDYTLFQLLNTLSANLSFDKF